MEILNMDLNVIFANHLKSKEILNFRFHLYFQYINFYRYFAFFVISVALLY